MIFYIFYITALEVQMTFGNFYGGGKHELPQINNENSYRCVQEGFFSDPRDCKKFYRCVNLNTQFQQNMFLKTLAKPQFIGYEFECSQGTIFNPDHNVCAHPQNTRRSECGGINANQMNDFNFQPNQIKQYKIPYASQNLFKNSQTPGLERGENFFQPPSSEVCTSPGYFPVKGNCHKFINCVDNGKGGFTKFEFACAPGTVWDSEKTICNHPSEVPGCGQGERPGQGGYPSPGERPGQGGYPSPGERPGQGGYPGPGERPGQGGYPSPGERPGQGGYPSPGERPGQGGYPGPGERPGQGGYPSPGERPGQGGYPSPGERPGQGGYPGPGERPGQGGYPGPEERPGQGGYPGPGERPGQGGYPSPGERPGQGGYPGSDSKPLEENTSPPSETSSEECKSSGFFGVKGNCKKYIRCVDKGNGDYNKFEFECGPGTVWDSQLNTCNYPSSVKGCENLSDNDKKDSKPCNTDQRGQTGCPDQLSKPNCPVSFTTPATSSSSCNSSNDANTKNETQQNTTPFPTNPVTSQSSQSPESYTTKSPLESDKDVSKQPESNEQGTTNLLNPTTTQSSTEEIKYPTSPPPGSFPCDEKKSSSPIKCEREGFYPLPDDCKKFYRCVNWDGNDGKKFSVYYFECASGTIWDPALETCNHEKSVYPPRNCNKVNNQGIQNPSEVTTTNSSESTTTEKPLSSFSTNQPDNLNTSVNPANQMTTNTDSTAIPDQTKGTTNVIDTTDLSTPNPTSSASILPDTTFMSLTDSTSSTDSSPEVTSSNPIDSAATTSSSSETIAISSTDVTPETTVMSSTEQEVTENTDPINSSPSVTDQSINTENTSPSDLTSSSEPSSESSTESLTEQSTNTENTSPSDLTSSSEPSSESSTESSTEQTSETNSVEQTDSTPDKTTESVQTSTPLPSTDSKCPKLKEDQAAFACPTGFKRHPKDCHMFYQCTSSKEMEDLNIVTFSCKNNTYFDETKIQCLPPEKTEPCETQRQKRKVRSIEGGKSSTVYVSANKKLCPTVGSFPYEGDCTRFYKCLKDEKGKIEGFMYQCPENYTFSATKDRCEKKLNFSKCKRSLPEVTERNLKWLKLKVPTEYISLEA